MGEYQFNWFGYDFFDTTVSFGGVPFETDEENFSTDVEKIKNDFNRVINYEEK